MRNVLCGNGCQPHQAFSYSRSSVGATVSLGWRAIPSATRRRKGTKPPEELETRADPLLPPDLRSEATLLAALEEPVIFNCTGLGAGELVGDAEIRPIKGQLTHLMPQPEVDYATFGGAAPSEGGFIHMQPRRDGIALGGTREEGD